MSMCNCLYNRTIQFCRTASGAAPASGTERPSRSSPLATILWPALWGWCNVGTMCHTFQTSGQIVTALYSPPWGGWLALCGRLDFRWYKSPLIRLAALYYASTKRHAYFNNASIRVGTMSFFRILWQQYPCHGSGSGTASPVLWPACGGCPQFWRYPPRLWHRSPFLASVWKLSPPCWPSAAGATLPAFTMWGCVWFRYFESQYFTMCPCVGVWLALYGLLCPSVIIYATMMARSQYGAN